MSRPRASGTAGVGPGFGSSAHKLWLQDASRHITQGCRPDICNIRGQGHSHTTNSGHFVPVAHRGGDISGSTQRLCGCGGGRLLLFPQVTAVLVQLGVGGPKLSSISCCRPKPPLRLLPVFYLPGPAGTSCMFTSCLNMRNRLAQTVPESSVLELQQPHSPPPFPKLLNLPSHLDMDNFRSIRESFLSKACLPTFFF